MALAGFACAIVTCIFTMIVIDVAVRMGCTMLYRVSGGTTSCSPPSFTLAVVEYALLWFAMCSAPWLVRQRGHVIIEAVVSVLPNLVRRAMAKIVYFVCLCASLLFVYYSAALVSG